MLFLDRDGFPGAVNLGVDQALLDDAARSGTATLRVYCWDPPCLSFGRNEAAALHYDRARIERLGINVARRPTGGRAVWHEHEVTYAVAAPVQTFGSLHEAYCAIHERLAVALRSLGADVSLAPDRRLTRPSTRPTAALPDRHGPCFNTVVGGEIVAGGRKLVGSAQVRQGNAFLQHGSILLAGSQEMIQAVSRQPSAVSQATTLSELLGRPVAFAEVANAVLAAFSDRVGRGAACRAPPSPHRRMSAARRAPTFRDPSWTWRR
jgi:lipoate-protein ligase A